MSGTLVYLFRHGEVTLAETRRFIGHLDVPLSARGVAGVRASGGRARRGGDRGGRARRDEPDAALPGDGAAVVASPLVRSELRGDERPRASGRALGAPPAERRADAKIRVKGAFR